MAHQQLSIQEREAILALLWEHRSVRFIARVLRRSPSSISREIKRNVQPEMRRYTPRLAQERAATRVQERGVRPRLKDHRVRQYVAAKLKKRWSPEQIAGRMEIEHPDWPSVSHEAVYQYIYADISINALASGDDLRQYLRRHHRIRKKKWVSHGNRGPIADRISIEERPAEVLKRERIGDWEDDSLVSKQSLVCLNSLVERTSGLLKLTKVEDNTAQETAAVVIRRLIEAPRDRRLTLTVDNGHEHARHQEVARTTGINVFFCHPYCSGERGTNENTNGLVREYFPKKTDFAKVSDDEVAMVEQILNGRPRKRLHYLTPLEVFNQGVAVKG